MIMFLLSIVEVNSIDAREAENHHGYIMAKLSKRLFPVTFRDGSIEKSPAIFHGDSLVFTGVSLWYFHLGPGIVRYTDNPCIIIIIVK